MSLKNVLLAGVGIWAGLQILPLIIRLLVFLTIAALLKTACDSIVNPYHYENNAQTVDSRPYEYSARNQPIVEDPPVVEDQPAPKRRVSLTYNSTNIIYTYENDQAARLHPVYQATSRAIDKIADPKNDDEFVEGIQLLINASNRGCSIAKYYLGHVLLGFGKTREAGELILLSAQAEGNTSQQQDARRFIKESYPEHYQSEWNYILYSN